MNKHSKGSEEYYLNLQRPRKYVAHERLAKHIYMLVDPLTTEIRYVGKAVYPKDRMRDHLKEKAETHKGRWIRSLLKEGRKPVMVLLETIEVFDGETELHWQIAEQRWIARLKDMGARLVNGTSGGDGVQNLEPEARRKLSTAWVGRKHKESTKQKISEYRKTYRASEETKEAQRRAMAGRKITWGDKVSTALRKISAEQELEIKRKRLDGVPVKQLASDYGVHIDTLRKVLKGTYSQKYRDQRKTQDNSAADLFSL